MKEKIFLVFSDIDDTFRPVDWRKPVDTNAIKNFYDFTKQLKIEGIETKLCFMSARPGPLVRSQMELINSIVGEKLSEVSVAEQGSIFVNLKSQKLIVNDFNKEITKIKKYVLKTYSDLFKDSEGSVTSLYFELKENGDNMLKEFREKVVALENDIKSKFDTNDLNIRIIHNVNGLEITDPKFDKDDGIKYLIDKYQRKYDIVGMTYSGDAINDIKAIKYMTKLAEVPGIKANVLIPNNATACINPSLESWKDRIKGTTKVIKKSTKNYFEGVVELLNDVHNHKELLGEGAYSKVNYSTDLTNSEHKNSLELILSKPKFSKTLPSLMNN